MTSANSLPPLALIAGGLATRLRPITTTIPKSLVEVAGEPFIAHQLRLLARQGICDIVICAGHLGEMIESFVGDGSRFGCRVSYSFDGEKLLGTGGALRRALPILGKNFWVMYGDSYLDIDYPPVYDAFLRSGLPALMTVFRNEGRWDTSNVEFRDGCVVRFDKQRRTREMTCIDFGLSILSADLIGSLPQDVPVDLADIYRDLASRGQLAGYEVHKRFYEIGSPSGLSETDQYLRSR